MARAIPARVRSPALTLALDPASASWTGFVPRRRDGTPQALPAVAAAARACRACPLWERATQTVFGEGPAGAPVMLVGEQPGDVEDRKGRPFVGPAGGLLARALEEAGLPRERLYVTNAVKHFNFVERGPRGKRIHQKPKGRDVKACQGWLAAEIHDVRPRLIVCLGATAAASLLGPAFRLTRQRGEILPTTDGPAVMATYHPSALLRAPDEAARAQMYRELVADLRRAASWLERG